MMSPAFFMFKPQCCSSPRADWLLDPRLALPLVERGHVTSGSARQPAQAVAAAVQVIPQPVRPGPGQQRSSGNIFINIQIFLPVWRGGAAVRAGGGKGRVDSTRCWSQAGLVGAWWRPCVTLLDSSPLVREAEAGSTTTSNPSRHLDMENWSCSYRCHFSNVMIFSGSDFPLELFVISELCDAEAQTVRLQL